jgi:hypothetical protein
LGGDGTVKISAPPPAGRFRAKVGLLLGVAATAATNAAPRPVIDSHLGRGGLVSHRRDRRIVSRARSILWGVKLFSLVALVLLASGAVRADELLLADPQLWPGEIFTTDGHRPEQRIFRLNPQPRAGRGGAVPRIASVAALQPDEIYFCSGLDGRVQRVDRATGEHDVIYTHAGLIRELAIHPSTGELNFSQVDAAEHGEPLRGGGVYRLDRQRGRAELVYEADQAALGHGWLGPLAFSEGKLHLATQSAPSRVVRVQGKELKTIFQTEDFRIRGLAFANERLLLLSGDGRLLEVTDPQRVREVMKFSHNFTSVVVVRTRHEEGR